MNLEDAIKKRKDCLKYLEGIGQMASLDSLEAVRWSVKALKALRPVSREQVEKVLRGEWVDKGIVLKFVICSKCGTNFEENFADYPFCPHCGAPMTDEAVQMVMERMEALKDGKGD